MYDIFESSFDPGERLQAPGSLWFLLLLYSSALHQHTDDNVPGTDVAMAREREV
jgi:hypothetical protein